MVTDQPVTRCRAQAEGQLLAATYGVSSWSRTSSPRAPPLETRPFAALRPPDFTVTPVPFICFQVHEDACPLPPLSSSQVLALQVFAAMPGLHLCFCWF